MRHPKWRSVALLAVLAMTVSACAQLQAVTPNEVGEVVITLTDYRISPSVIEVQAGQTVRFVITNEGQHTHEFMVGRHPIPNEVYLEKEVYEPFAVDFFAGLDVEITGTGMPMNFAGMDGMDMGGDEGGMDMGGDEGGMDMGGDEGGMDMGGDEGGMDMGGDEGGMDMGGDEGGEADHGAMVMFEPGSPTDPSQPGQSVVMEFVVPEDAVGTWQIGCFQEAGQHFEDGMQATLIVNS